MLKLSKAQYKQLCADCAAEMMRGAGHGGKNPDFSGTDMKFYVKDKTLKGGGFTDTLSNTWSKVKQFVSESPLAQKVVKQGLAKGKPFVSPFTGAPGTGFDGTVPTAPARAQPKFKDQIQCIRSTSVGPCVPGVQLH